MWSALEKTEKVDRMDELRWGKDDVEEWQRGKAENLGY